MITTHPDLLCLLLAEIVRLRADLAKADQENILMAEQLEWTQNRLEMLEAAVNAGPNAGGRRIQINL